MGVLVNPTNTALNELMVNELQTAARALGKKIHVVKASSSQQIDETFATLMREQVGALFVAPDGFFNSRRVQLTTLAMQHAIPAAYGVRDYPESGGLMSYGPSLPDTFRQIGVYAGRLLKGEKVSNLPVQQPTKFHLVINLKTAKALGLTVPPTLLARADEVIE